MSDVLINQQAAIMALVFSDDTGGMTCGQMAKVIDVIKTVPPVDAVPVVHGRWIREDFWSKGVGMGESYGYYYKCSKCGNLVRGGYDECGKKYCDECGARMDGKDGDRIEQ